MRVDHFTDEIKDQVIAGTRPLTKEEREFLIMDTPMFEECGRDLAVELPKMSDPDLMRAAYGVWADYASGF
jgi:hypothetical protein